MSYLEWLSELIRSLKLSDNDGVIYTNLPDVKPTLVKVGEHPLVLPTEFHVQTAVKVNDGKSETVKVLFNPLAENAISSSDNKSLIKVRHIGDSLLSHAFIEIAKTVDYVLTSSKYRNNVPLSLIPLKEGKASKQNMKSLLSKLGTHSMTHNNAKAVSYIIKKNTKIDGVEFICRAEVHSPMITMLENLPEPKVFQDTPVSNVVLVFLQNLWEIITPDKYIGSNNMVAPILHVYLKAYNSIAERINSLVDSLVIINSEDAELAGLNSIKLNVITGLDKFEEFKKELLFIPIGETISKPNTVTSKVQQNTVATTQGKSNVELVREALGVGITRRRVEPVPLHVPNRAIVSPRNSLVTVGSPDIPFEAPYETRRNSIPQSNSRYSNRRTIVDVPYKQDRPQVKRNLI